MVGVEGLGEEGWGHLGGPGHVGEGVVVSDARPQAREPHVRHLQDLVLAHLEACSRG